MNMNTHSIIKKATKDLHGRNAVELVHSLTPFKSSIYLKIDDRRINLKSILGLLSADIHEGALLTIEILEDNELEEICKAIDKFFSMS